MPDAEKLLVINKFNQALLSSNTNDDLEACIPLVDTLPDETKPQALEAIEGRRETINPIVKIADLEIDIRKAFPLTIGDGKKLKQEGINIYEFYQTISSMESDNDLSNLEPDVMSEFVYFVLVKAEPKLTVAQLDSVPLPRLLGLMLKIGTIANLGQRADPLF